MHQSFGIRASCKHIHAMVNQAHAFVQKSSNDVWPQKNHFASRNARPGLVVLFFSSAIYYLFSFDRVWQFIQCLPSSLALCWYCFHISREYKKIGIRDHLFAASHTSIDTFNVAGCLFRQFEKRNGLRKECGQLPYFSLAQSIDRRLESHSFAIVFNEIFDR